MSPFARLAAAPRGEPLVFLHSCGAGPSELFAGPVEVLAVPASPAPRAELFARLDEFLAHHRGRACAGFASYELRSAVEALPLRIRDGFPQPALWLGAFAERSVWPAAHDPAQAELAARAVPASGLRALDTRAGYEAKVARVVEHIRAGDLFQANLTQAFEARYDGDPRALFAKLCTVSPAPYAAYVETDDGLAVLSASPEEFLVADGSAVRTRPIKGTRPRATDPEADAALLAELLASEKDQAELAMIVDLLRNDLGKLAQVGSVAVGPFPEHASYAQVHHLFATVTARLRDGTSTGELLRATFPGGSITGAPKLRSMELLEELESCRRGVYCGAIGEFAHGARVRLNVAIRTMACRAGRIRLHAGGGVTADSEPAAEYEETLHKAAGMLRALALEAEALREARG